MNPPFPTPCESLTSRESEIMEHLCRGLLYKEIASLLFICQGTVKQHIHHIYCKLKARNRTEAITIYLNSKM